MAFPIFLSKQEAKEIGSIFYFTGIGCLHGHIAKRYTKTDRCYECHKITKKVFKNSDKGRELAKVEYQRYKGKREIRTRLRRYGCSDELYQKLLLDQNGQCAICQTSFSIKPPCVDHCHETTVVRGLLCRACNTGIGVFVDNVDSLHRAIDYLQRFKGN